MLRRLFPHPLLTVTLTAAWIGLVNDFAAGHLVLGLILATLIPLLTSSFWPDRPRLRNPVGIAAYCLIVLWDICVANVVVAGLILFRRPEALRTHWLVVPLKIRSPEAITCLAGTITMTPGTVTADVADDGRSILVHCLDTGDPDATIEEIKNRYETRLKEIFE